MARIRDDQALSVAEIRRLRSKKAKESSSVRKTDLKKAAAGRTYRVTKRPGLFTVTDLGEILGVTHQSLRYAIQIRSIPEPTRQDKLGRPRRYYNADDIKVIMKTLAVD